MTAHMRVAPARTGQASAGWRAHLAVLGAVELATLLLFRRDAADVVAIWWTSSSYGHALLIGPIIAWLVIERAPELRLRTPRAWMPGLALIGLGGFGWLLGDAAGLALARHFGLLMMIQGGVVACLGPAVTRGLLFPLGYALFLVPFGEELVPPLQTLTARMSMALLGLAGVPAHIDGVFIAIPNGLFEVAEACSGVKFLMAMAAYAVLVAQVCFRSWKRRLLFVGAAIVAPVLANGLRAFATIYVAHLRGVEAAAGFDHVVYGWIFFALVMAGVTAAGWPFFDRRPGEPWLGDASPALHCRPCEGRAPSLLPHAVSAAESDMGASLRWDDGYRRLAFAAIAGLLFQALPIVWSARAAGAAQELAGRSELPEVSGWRRVAAAGTPWRPRFDGADRLLSARYRDRAGRAVDLAIAVYARQAEGRELVGHGQGAIDPAGDWAWVAESAPPAGGRAFRIAAPGPVNREVAIFYRIGGVTTGNEVRVKLETLKVRLLGRRQAAAALIVTSEERAGRGSARAAIDAFLGALGPVERVADRAAGL